MLAPSVLRDVRRPSTPGYDPHSCHKEIGWDFQNFDGVKIVWKLTSQSLSLTSKIFTKISFSEKNWMVGGSQIERVRTSPSPIHCKMFFDVSNVSLSRSFWD